MLSSNSNTSLARSRSLRVPAAGTLKPSSNTSTIQASSGPSNVTLFLTNLRLLDLDLRSDWPDITTLTFSTKDAQQNQKKRIQCVEWALYHLFVLWDPEEAKNKLQPFFPPLEQLQSLNLRAALFRCLDNVKKMGGLGRDTVLRKTMLDECKGERLEEVLAVLSHAVLKKVLQETDDAGRSLARELAFENFSYHGERGVLTALVLAHRVSLTRHLREKEGMRARARDFGELLDLNQRRITRREEQLKEIVRERGLEEQLLRGEVQKLQRLIESNWTGSDEWLRELLLGQTQRDRDGLLAARFDKVWKHVEAGRIGDLEGTTGSGLAEELDARVKDQEKRLARWQAFGKKLEKKGPVSPSKKRAQQPEVKGFDLGFDKHQHLHVGMAAKEHTSGSSQPGRYAQLIDDMQMALAEVGKPKIQQSISIVDMSFATSLQLPEVSPEESSTPPIENVEEEEWASASDASDIEGPSASRTPALPHEYSFVSKQKSQRSGKLTFPPPEKPRPLEKPSIKERKPVEKQRTIHTQRSISPLEPLRTTTPVIAPEPKPQHTTRHEVDLADEILNSMAAASPSPKKRHTLSLAERTRLSMARNSHAKFSDFHDDFEPDPAPRLSIKPRFSFVEESPPEDAAPGKHADLIERTRKSMVGFEAAQKKAQLERRRSVKAEQKRQRQSSYFPKVEEEDGVEPKMVDALEEDPEYAAVFKSRPKIATSPGPSPRRRWDEGMDD